RPPPQRGRLHRRRRRRRRVPAHHPAATQRPGDRGLPGPARQHDQPDPRRARRAGLAAGDLPPVRGDVPPRAGHRAPPADHRAGHGDGAVRRGPHARLRGDPRRRRRHDRRLRRQPQPRGGQPAAGRPRRAHRRRRRDRRGRRPARRGPHCGEHPGAARPGRAPGTGGLRRGWDARRGAAGGVVEPPPRPRRRRGGPAVTPPEGATTPWTEDELLAGMTLEEKLAQLVGLWEGRGGRGGGEVAPMQHALQSHVDRLEDFATHGLGHLTRVFGTRPVDPREQARALAGKQEWLRTRTRLGIRAIVHEECLTGLATWQATTYPSPPAWGATFDPALVAEMGRAIGGSMRSLGVHQGLAPVLDVVRDARWGRVEECISEDPYLVGEIGTAYVRGMQDAGVVATLKHFVGYSSSRAGRNLAPVHAGPREVADVLLPPFEMAVRDGGAGSVMSAYTEIDGVPVAGDAALLT